MTANVDTDTDTDTDTGPVGRGRPAVLRDILARHPDQIVPVAGLVEELWPGADVATGRARLHVVASRMRRCLPPGTSLEAVDDGYRLVGAGPGETGEDRAGSASVAGPAPRVPDLVREPTSRLVPAAGEVALVVVSAPTGYGKTVVLRRWSARQPGLVRWVDLAIEHDPGRALDTALGVVAGATAEDRRGPGHPVAVVVDGVERVADLDLGPRVERVLRRGSPVTLVLSSRVALPLPVGRMVVRGDAVVLGPDDLGLTVAEAELLRPGAGPGLMRLTGGWPEAAVRLAPVPDPDGPGAAAVLADLRQRIVDDLGPDLAALLEATAPLAHIRPALADAVTADEGSGPRLDVLADRHHLLVREGGGFRPRPAVRLALAAGTVDGPSRTRHRRAARWYLGDGQPEPALHHAAAARDRTTVRAAFVPAVRAAAERGDGATLLAWATAIRPPSHADAAAVALVVWALGPSPTRDRWRPGPGAPPVVAAAARAVEGLGGGRADDARADVARARSGLGEIGVDVRPALDGLLHVVELEASTLLGREVGARPGDLGPRPWPWFVHWGFGIRALAAELAGRRREAAALVEHGRVRAGSPEASSDELAPGPWALARALVDLDRPGSASDRALSVTVLEALARRLDAVHHQPLALMTRHALHLACRRAGDEAAAARWLADADRRSRSLPDLPLLRRSRVVLVQRAGQPPLEGLSAQERRVLGYLSTDMALVEIADALFLSPHTVKAHTRSIYRKLRVHSRGAAVDAVLRP